MKPDFHTYIRNTGWNTEYPFVGTALFIIGGVLIGYISIRVTLGLAPIVGAYPILEFLSAILLTLICVFTLLRPDPFTFIGIAGVTLSIISISSGLDGWFAGLLLGIAGGNLIIAWYPPEFRNKKEPRSTGKRTRRHSSNAGFSGEEEQTTRLSNTDGRVERTSDSAEISKNAGSFDGGPVKFTWQADPFALQPRRSNVGMGKPGKAAGTCREVTNTTDYSHVWVHEFSGPIGGKTVCQASPSSANELPTNLRHISSSEYQSDNQLSFRNIDLRNHGERTPAVSVINDRLNDALERVGHGATVSFPSILVKKALYFIMTAILTNGFTASSYGLFVLAQKLLTYLSNSMSGFLTGINRYLPNASTTNQNILATFASLLMLGVGTIIGAVVFIAAPSITQTVNHGQQFQIFIRVFAVGFPGTLWLLTVTKLLEGLEEVEAFNLLFRLGFPTVELVVVAIGTFIFKDLIVVAVGIVVTTVLISLILTIWLMWNRGLSLRLRGISARRIHRKYVRFSLPLVLRGIVINVQGASFYLLILFLLSAVAGGVFTVGVLIGSLVKLPLVLNNQFMSPVVSDLHEQDHQKALVRLYQVTSRLILVGITAVSIPLLVYRETVMGLFGATYVTYTALLPAFIFANYLASAAGGVGIILKMTDHHRAFTIIDTTTALIVMAGAIPLTMVFGLRGLVISYLAKNVINNALETVTLYHLDGYHPFTRLHAKPIFAAVPYIIFAFGGKVMISGPMAPVVGTIAGIVAYTKTLQMLGFTNAERRLASSLVARYRETSVSLLNSSRL